MIKEVRVLRLAQFRLEQNDMAGTGSKGPVVTSIFRRCSREMAIGISSSSGYTEYIGDWLCRFKLMGVLRHPSRRTHSIAAMVSTVSSVDQSD